MDAHIRKVYVPMTETGFHILLCLQTPRHGYGVREKVEALTGGALRLSPGTENNSHCTTSPRPAQRRLGGWAQLPSATSCITGRPPLHFPAGFL